jgi:hypothetical protein
MIPMAIFSFLFFFMSAWFQGHTKLTWSSPQQRASYAVGLAFLGLCFSLSSFINDTILTDSNSTIPKIYFIAIGIGAILLFDYIYIKRERIYTIKPSKFWLTKSLGEDACKLIAVGVIFFLILSPFLEMLLFMPANNK